MLGWIIRIVHRGRRRDRRDLPDRRRRSLAQVQGRAAARSPTPTASWPSTSGTAASSAAPRSTMTAAQDGEEPEAPRHCREDMVPRRAPSLTARSAAALHAVSIHRLWTNLWELTPLGFGQIRPNAQSARAVDCRSPDCGVLSGSWVERTNPAIMQHRGRGSGTSSGLAAGQEPEVVADDHERRPAPMQGEHRHRHPERARA